MDKRVRSPNYPALSLPEALEKVRLVFERQHTHGAPRDVVVKSMGYTGINGASATAISALHKYGLLDGRGDEVRVSDRAMRYLNPMSDEERADAIREAAYEPTLFRELSEKFPGRLPSEDVLRSYLVRNGFSPAAVSGVILNYRQTIELVERPEGAYNSAPVTSTPEGIMTQASHSSFLGRLPQPTDPDVVFRKDERSLGRHDFEDGSYVRISVHGDLDTVMALKWAEILIANKRQELEMLGDARHPAVVAPENEKEDENKHA